MSKFGLARSGATAAVLAILGVLLLGITSAGAEVLLFSGSHVNVKVTGGEATALNSCLNDAQDGFIQTQQNACDQFATASNLVDLEDTSIWVQSAGFPSVLLFSHSHVRVQITGGLVSAINSCVNDAQDGVIQTQVNTCHQISTAGNLLNLVNVGVGVFQ